MQPITCTECDTRPVRKGGSHLCRYCFEVALRDLLREDKPCQSHTVKS